VRGEESDDVKESLVKFLVKLAGGGDVGEERALALGWINSTDPCPGATGNGSVSKWGEQVVCFNNGDPNAGKIKYIDLQSQNLNGTIDASLLCAARALRRVNLQNNSLTGGLPASISACSGLPYLFLDHNRLSGSLPSSLGQLRRLRVLDVSRNDFSGELPDSLRQLPNLVRFAANNNHFDGTILGLQPPQLPELQRVQQQPHRADPQETRNHRHVQLRGQRRRHVRQTSLPRVSGIAFPR
jgi:hypothetical protein